MVVTIRSFIYAEDGVPSVRLSGQYPLTGKV